MKDSDSQYTLWCSGRTCCEGMLVELKLIKRQDLVAVIAQLMRPLQDQVLDCSRLLSCCNKSLTEPHSILYCINEGP